MSVGSRVVVVAAWSMFRDRIGEVVQVVSGHRYLVMFPGEPRAMLFGVDSIREVS